MEGKEFGPDGKGTGAMMQNRARVVTENVAHLLIGASPWRKPGA